MRSVIDWIENRTGLETAIKHFLQEDIPDSSGWHQVLGSMAMFSFLVQAVTGILLAFNYAPTPGEAYNSLKYIVTELTAGSLIRGLHHWGASMMIVIVVCHMIQVFVYGAYKKPREATWMVGVVLLLLTLAFGLTGYLLPWDNKAYWGTVVTTQIMSQAPVAGPYLSRLLGGSNGVGVVTFARFYAMHVLLLPPLTMLLIAGHVYLVRKHGVAPAVNETKPPKKFFPEQVFKDTLAIFIGFLVLFTLAVLAKLPLERLADPTDTTYIPRPEWYFLFLFQTLKFLPGALEVVGSTILPGLAILALFCAPFIDRGPMQRLRNRTVAIGIVVLAGIGWTGLTAAAYITTPKNMETAGGGEGTLAWERLTAPELAGLGLYRRENCVSCHLPGGKSGIGPSLTKSPEAHRTAAWLIPFFRQPAKVIPGSSMPPVQESSAQLNDLAAFVIKLTADDEQALMATPDFATQAALLYQAQHCSACHQINGAGMKLGPPLNGVAGHRDRAWLEKHFRDPQSTSPGTVMPPYKFTDKEMDAMCRYLLALPK
jgi:ubiquinol-cytochrome c reductase cytochrome b subunit